MPERKLLSPPPRRQLLSGSAASSRPKLHASGNGDSLPPPKGGGRYFDEADGDISKLEGFSTGCKVFDCALTGPAGKGWILGRVSNVVGDKSTGKTLVAIEAMANFARKYTDASKFKIRYYEVEDAFDDAYAATLGMPMDRVERGGQNADTVGDFERDLTQWLEKIPKNGGGLYIIDSLDALAADDEVEVKMKKKKNRDGTEETSTTQEAGSYGTAKAKKMSQMFRRLVRKIGRANVHLMIISQLRDKIGVMFGEKQTRAGGRALDFYATHVIWLAHLGQIKMTRSGIDRPIGVQVRVKVKKNKVALPFREAEYPILFGYGIDDVQAALDWLGEVGRLSEVGIVVEKKAEAEDGEKKQSGKNRAITNFMKNFHRLTPSEASTERRRVNKVLRRVWGDVESLFMPPQGKYD